jgi:hypothetical protein
MKLGLFLILMLTLPVFGEDLADAPHPAYTAYIAESSSRFIRDSAPRSSTPFHDFLDHGNKIRMGILAGVIAADGISTQAILNGQGGARWREMNPLARPFVNRGAPGQFAASALGFGFSLGTSYLFHRTGHHRLEKLMLDAAIGVETAVVANNLIGHSIR